MLNLIRKFLRPTLREQLEDGVREALRRYADRHSAPNLRVYVSTDLVPKGIEHQHWARDETEHLRRFALQWAEDNDVPHLGLRSEIILLDTKREFAFVKPVGAVPGDSTGTAPAKAAQAGGAPRLMVEPDSQDASALLEVLESPTLKEPLRIAGELIVGRRAEGNVVRGLGDRYMSARHARFHLSAGTLFVTDLDSKNRTFLNDEPLPPHQAMPAVRGDRIRMGTTTFRVSQVT
jgi:hypothetical protein